MPPINAPLQEMTTLKVLLSSKLVDWITQWIDAGGLSNFAKLLCTTFSLWVLPPSPPWTGKADSLSPSPISLPFSFLLVSSFSNEPVHEQLRENLLTCFKTLWAVRALPTRFIPLLQAEAEG